MTNPTPREIAWPVVRCCNPPDCMCGTEERALRGWIRGDDLPPMTPVQRNWCLTEISVTEGYQGREHQADDDATLAATVLDAWADYCRDKGLIP